MHPHIQTWGSMLRLYGSRMEESYLKPDGKVRYHILRVEQLNRILKSLTQSVFSSGFIRPCEVKDPLYL